jgi:hypothetical protein
VQIIELNIDDDNKCYLTHWSFITYFVILNTKLKSKVNMGLFCLYSMESFIFSPSGIKVTVA